MSYNPAVAISAELDQFRIVLVSPRNPLNIGAVARSMSNFGFPQLRVVNPYEVAFREARSAVGAARVLQTAEEFKNVADAVADCRLVVGTTAVGERELHHPVETLEAAAQRMREVPGSVALLFGSEKRGLSNEDLSYCHWILRIPTRTGHRSMNLGQAAAVCFYELARASAQSRNDWLPSSVDELPAAAAELQRLCEVLLQVLLASGYTTSAGHAATTEEKLRRMIHRLHLNGADADVLLGMLRKILWKLEHPHSQPE